MYLTSIPTYYNNITREIKSTGQRHRVMVYHGQSRRRRDPYNSNMMYLGGTYEQCNNEEGGGEGVVSCSSWTI